MKLIYKLILGYVILVVLAMVTDIVSVRSYQKIENSYKQVSERAVPQIQALEKMKSAILRIVGSTSEYVLLVSEHAASDTDKEPEADAQGAGQSSEQETANNKQKYAVEEEKELTEEGKQALEENLNRYEVLTQGESADSIEFMLTRNIRAASQRLLADSARIISLKKNNLSGKDIVQAKEEFEESEQLTLNAIQVALDEEYEELKKAENTVHTVITDATYLTTLIDLISVLLALVVGAIISKSVSTRINKLKDAMQSVSAGNLDERIATDSSDEIGALGRSFNAMTDALKQSRQDVLSARVFAENIIESMSDLLVVADATATIRRVNSAAAALLGLAPDEIIGQPLSGLSDDSEFIPASDLALLTDGASPISYEKFCATRDGRKVPLSVSVAALRNITGQMNGLVCVARDITAKKQAEEKIHASLVEKEVLLKEIHHRVKNNLQIISSLLSMQARKITDKKSHAIFVDSQNRVKSMALIHESLYQSSDLSQIDVDEYLRKLASHILRSYNLNSDRIRLIFSNSSLQISVEAAVPCGLIINELVSNALKYAFPDERSGEIAIALEATPQNFTLRCADNGVGLSPEFDIRQTDSLGLKIVRNLTDQLNGDLVIHTEHGTTFEITFPRL